MSLSDLFIARPVATWLLALAVLLAGALGCATLPIAALPPLDVPTLQVTTQLPGANADVVASLITAPLERQLGQIAGLQEMSSSSAQGSSQITLQFALDRSMDSAAQDVQAAIDVAAGTLPQNLAYPPVISRVNPADAPILTLALQSDTRPLARLSDVADTVLQPRLSQVSGVGRVVIQGGLKPALRVRVDPARLAVYGLSLEDVRSAIGQNSLEGAKGSIDGPLQAATLGANDQLLTPGAFADIVVASRHGVPVHIRDVGSVVDGLENNRVASWLQGRPAVLIDIQRQPGANVVQTVARLRQALPDLAASLPADMRLSVVSDRTDAIRANLVALLITLLLAMALVVLVIRGFLRSWRATLVPAVALPLSLIGTFGVMALCGFSLDTLSMMALILASGLVVDDAIVMIENIMRHIEQGASPLVAAMRGARQIGFTIVSLTASLVAVFIPLLFMSGVVGRMFREFALTLCIAVIVSAVISLTLTPMMCGRLLRDQPGRGEATEGLLARLLAAYRHSLGWALRHQGLVLVVGLGSLAGSVALAVSMPKGFLPQQDTGVIAVLTEAAPGISIHRLSALQTTAAALVATYPGVDSVTAFVGATPGNPTPNTGRMTIVLKPRAERTESAAAIARHLRLRLAPIAGLRSVLQPVQDLQIGTHPGSLPFQITLVDRDRQSLAALTPRLLARLRALPQLRDVVADAQPDGRRTLVQVDRAAAARLGVSMQTVQDILYDAFGQRQVSTIFAQDNQYRVVLEADPAWQGDDSSLQKLYVPGAAGTQVPLSAIARLETTTAPLAINRIGQFPAVTFAFDLAPGAALGDAVATIDRVVHETAPTSASAQLQGDAAAFEAALEGAPWLILGAAVVIYIVLGVLYESFVHPLTILSTLPSAGIGALLALRLAGLDLSMLALVGILVLMGIVKKNAIMMIDFAIEAGRDGLAPEAAITDACLRRFRPIMMTTLAALLGALPLLDSGDGAEVRLPLGVTIVGGLLLSQFLTLYTTPVIYLALERLRVRAPVRQREAVPAE